MLYQQSYTLRQRKETFRSYGGQLSIVLNRLIKRTMTKSLLILIALASTVTLVNATETSSETPNWDSIAEKIVRSALNIQTGETVIITGGPTQIDLLEALQVAVSKSGGVPSVELDLPSANKRILMETPLRYLGQPPLYTIQQMRLADAFIYVRTIEDPSLYTDVPEERFTAARRSVTLTTQAFKRSHFREVTLGQTGGIPTEAFAKSQGANYTNLIKMFWNSLDVNYDDLLASARNVAKKLPPNSVLHLTNATGTNLTFRINNTPPRLNTGRTVDNIMASGPSQVWLPAGEAYVCTQPNSATGTLVIPNFTFRGIPITNLRIKFQSGRIKVIEGDDNVSRLQEYLNSATGDIGVLSVVDIGVNSNSYVPNGSTFFSYEMGGMITLGIGNSSWAGCQVEADAGLSLYVTGSTLIVNDETIVENGKLKM